MHGQHGLPTYLYIELHEVLEWPYALQCQSDWIWEMCYQLIALCLSLRGKGWLRGQLVGLPQNQGLLTRRDREDHEAVLMKELCQRNPRNRTDCAMACHIRELVWGWPVVSVEISRKCGVVAVIPSWLT